MLAFARMAGEQGWVKLLVTRRGLQCAGVGSSWLVDYKLLQGNAVLFFSVPSAQYNTCIHTN